MHIKVEESASTCEGASEEIMVNLSEDVLVEILARLPVKSLMRFKSVCKSWYKLICDSSFIRKHFIHYTKSHILVVGTMEIRFEGDAFSLITSHDGIGSDQFASLGTKIDTTLLMDFRETNHKEFTYSCHGIGIVCFINYMDDNIALWNPTTREFRILPELCEPVCVSPDTRLVYPPFFFCGLGFDSSCNDYKLVHFGYRYVNNASNMEEEPVTLYTWSTNSWKKLDVRFNAQPWPRCQTAAFINGSPWWLAIERERFDDPMLIYYPKLDGYDLIVSFDVNAEVFRYYELPECCRGFYIPYYSLIQVQRYVALCLCPHDYLGEQDQSFDIWIMKELGLEVSWTKIYSLGPFRGVDKIIGFWPSNEILVLQQESSKLMFYDIATHRIVHVELNVPQLVDRHEVFLFCDSLVQVALNSDTVDTGGRI